MNGRKDEQRPELIIALIMAVHRCLARHGVTWQFLKISRLSAKDCKQNLRVLRAEGYGSWYAFPKHLPAHQVGGQAGFHRYGF